MPILEAQTEITFEQLQTLCKQSDPDFYKTGVDFDIAASRALPPYAKAYAGRFYIESSQVSGPTAVPTEYKSTANGKFYEIPLPSTCNDDGAIDLLLFNGGVMVPPANVVKNTDKQTWDDISTTICPFRCSGRTLELFIPAVIGASTPVSYVMSFTREPIIPTSPSEQLDVPAEDFENFLTAYKAVIQKV